MSGERAEELPFEDDSFDAAMAMITVHHWPDQRAGLAEMARVARTRAVVMTFDPEPLADLWLARDYFPGAFKYHFDAMPSIEALRAGLGGARVEAVPIPRRCTDGFFCALWDRPEMHLDPGCGAAARSGTSCRPRTTRTASPHSAPTLRAAIWDERHGHLREHTPELDVGLRLVVAELG